MFNTISVTVSKTDYDGPVFHSVTFEKEHNSTIIMEDICARAEAAGWEIVSVVVEYDDYWKEEMISSDHKPKNYLELLEFFDLICDNEYMVESILAYVKEFGFDVSGWEDNIKISGDHKSELAINWLDTFGDKLYKEVYKPSRYSTEFVKTDLPNVLSIDWDDTADNIAASEGYTITYLNGTWYMFD